MSKALLVVDMPENCMDCPCSFFERSNPKLNLICGPTQEDVNGDGKPNWCPLKPKPKHKYDEDKREDSMKIRGYNACLDDIFG